MNKEKPIIFSTEMVHKILSGEKNQTRRVVKIPSWTWDKFDDLKLGNGELIAHNRKKGYVDPINPPYAVGDVLWVRETFYEECETRRNADGEPEHWRYGQYAYFADGVPQHSPSGNKWELRPAIHMPREAARIFLQVKSIRPERLHSMTKEDAVKEGISPDGQIPEVCCPTCKGTQRTEGICCPDCKSVAVCFSRLWDSLNADRGYGWDKNPWVWVVEFERVELTEDGRE